MSSRAARFDVRDADEDWSHAGLGLERALELRAVLVERSPEHGPHERSANSHHAGRPNRNLEAKARAVVMRLEGDVTVDWHSFDCAQPEHAVGLVLHDLDG